MGTFELKTALLKKIEECEQLYNAVKDTDEIIKQARYGFAKLAYEDCLSMIDEHMLGEFPSD